MGKQVYLSNDQIDLLVDVLSPGNFACDTGNEEHDSAVFHIRDQILDMLKPRKRNYEGMKPRTLVMFTRDVMTCTGNRARAKVGDTGFVVTQEDSAGMVSVLRDGERAITRDVPVSALKVR